MGQKTNPIGNRLGFIKGWDSNWYGGKNYTEKLVEDYQIRRRASMSEFYERKDIASGIYD